MCGTPDTLTCLGASTFLGYLLDHRQISVGKCAHRGTSARQKRQTSFKIVTWTKQTWTKHHNTIKDSGEQQLSRSHTHPPTLPFLYFGNKGNKAYISWYWPFRWWSWCWRVRGWAWTRRPSSTLPKTIPSPRQSGTATYYLCTLLPESGFFREITEAAERKDKLKIKFCFRLASSKENWGIGEKSISTHWIN